ncbi:MAG: Spx/MgsR family RNA polymerase-binding regulatory protein [Lacunisphaera sp.]
MSGPTVYTLANCSTCRDATKWLRARGVAFQEKAIRETPPTLAELRTMLAAYDGKVSRLFNTSGLEYRALGLAQKLPGLTSAEALKLLAGNGRLVKRPFLIGEGVAVVGFDADLWQRVWGRMQTQR